MFAVTVPDTNKDPKVDPVFYFCGEKVIFGLGTFFRITRIDREAKKV
jgi:hypothetical protein